MIIMNFYNDKPGVEHDRCNGGISDLVRVTDENASGFQLADFHIISLS